MCNDLELKSKRIRDQSKDLLYAFDPNVLLKAGSFDKVTFSRCLVFFLWVTQIIFNQNLNNSGSWKCVHADYISFENMKPFDIFSCSTLFFWHWPAYLYISSYGKNLGWQVKELRSVLTYKNLAIYSA